MSGMEVCYKVQQLRRQAGITQEKIKLRITKAVMEELGE